MFKAFQEQAPDYIMAILQVGAENGDTFGQIAPGHHVY